MRMIMHYTGTIWRPPYEADSLLLEVTAGCTHHKCKFCTLYNDLHFSFRMSPMEDIESDLQEAQLWGMDPLSRQAARLWGVSKPERIRRVFLTGANPFVLKQERLVKIAELIQKYLPSVQTIGCFARITDIGLKSDEELSTLQRFGYDGITIGIETGDDTALEFMRKGYAAADILEQCQRLDRAGIHYNFFYLAGISGAGHGELGAKMTAELCNQLHPRLIGINMLTIYSGSELYGEIQRGSWQEETELEKYREIRTLIEHLQISTVVAAMGASNAYQFQGRLPEERDKLLSFLDSVPKSDGEEKLRQYRKEVRHL